MLCTSHPYRVKFQFAASILRRFRTGHIGTVVGCLVLLLASSFTVPGISQPDRDDDLSQILRAQIERLTHDDFQVREEAERQILEIGTPAIPELKKLRRAGDSELRHRVVRILTLLESQRREEQVQRFLDGDESLPGWPTYATVIGKNANSRREFAELYRQETERLERLQRGADSIDQLQSWVDEFNQSRRFHNDAFGSFMACISLQSIIACEFLADDAASPATLSRNLDLWFMQPVFHQLLDRNQYQELHRAAMEAWISLQHGDRSSFDRRMSIALNHNFPQGLIPAVASLNENPDRIPGRSVRMAMMLVARHGDRSHVKLVSQYLDNPQILYSGQVMNSQQQLVNIRTTVGDYALATLIHLTDRDYRDFGMDVGQSPGDGPLSVEQAGFPDESRRNAAKEKWKDLTGNGTSDPEGHD